MSDLTDKQRVFIEEYLTCWNATEAARRAGYAFPNVEGARLLVNASIAAEVQARLSTKGMAADEAVARLADQARADIRHLLAFDQEGNVTGLRLHIDAPLHLVKSVTPTKYGTKVELYDAQSALVNILKMHGLFRETDSNDDSEEEYTEEEARALIEGILAAKRGKRSGGRSRKNTAQD